jgi:hypothetical protein
MKRLFLLAPIFLMVGSTFAQSAPESFDPSFSIFARGRITTTTTTTTTVTPPPRGGDRIRVLLPVLVGVMIDNTSPIAIFNQANAQGEITTTRFQIGDVYPGRAAKISEITMDGVGLADGNFVPLHHDEPTRNNAVVPALGVTRTPAGRNPGALRTPASPTGRNGPLGARTGRNGPAAPGN